MMPAGPRHKSIGLFSISAPVLLSPPGVEEALREINPADLRAENFCLVSSTAIAVDSPLKRRREGGGTVDFNG